MSAMAKTIGLILLMVMALATPAAPAPPQRVLKVAYADDVVSFDPDNAFLLYGLEALRVMYQGLVQYEPGTTRVTGWLAQSWSVSPDARTYTFRLHDGARFHDGSPVTAAAVMAYFQRRATPTLALSYFLDNVASMSAPDRLTFVIRLRSPQSTFLDRLASPWGPKVIGPGALVGHAGGDLGGSWLNEHEDGCGPYRLTEFSRDYRYVLTRDPDYWGPRPYFDRIEIDIVPSISQQMLMVRRGDLDVMMNGYPFDQLAHLPPDLRATGFDDLGEEMALVNPWHSLKDRKLRWAVLTALNPAGWLADDFDGYATQARSLYPKAMIDAPRPVVFPGDLAAARRIVAAHGPVHLQIGYGAEEGATQQRTAELLVSALARIGISATVMSMPTDQEPGLRDFPQRAPDLWLARNYPDAAHPGTQADVFFETGAPLNLFNYSNPSVDRLIGAAGQITDRAARDRAYLAISDALFADIAFIPLADIKDVIVYRADLTDLGTRPALPWGVDYATIRRR